MGDIAGGVLSGVAGIGNMLGNLIGRKKRQRALNAREDSSVQRRAADLEKAGLSQTLAAGGGAQSSDVAMQDAGGGDIVADAFSTAEAATAIKKQKADISKTASEKKLTDLQAERQKLENENYDADRWNKMFDEANRTGPLDKKEARDKAIYEWNMERARQDKSPYGVGKEAKFTTAINDIIELLKSTGGGAAIDEAVDKAKSLITPKTPDEMSDFGLGVRKLFGNQTPEQAAEQQRRANEKRVREQTGIYGRQ